MIQFVRPVATQVTVLEFRGPHFFLSNFYPWIGRAVMGVMCPVMFEDVIYPSSEHAYQAAKSPDHKIRNWISNMVEPLVSGRNPASQAKRAGKDVRLRSDWDKVKDDVMYAIVFDKFTRHEHLRRLLLATGQAVLEEGNNWNDRYWGICPPGSGIGRNQLGTTLMRVREEIR